MKAYDIEVQAVESCDGEDVVYLTQDNGQVVIMLYPEQIDLVIKWLKIAKTECIENGGQS